MLWQSAPPPGLKREDVADEEDKQSLATKSWSIEWRSIVAHRRR